MNMDHKFKFTDFVVVDRLSYFEVESYGENYFLKIQQNSGIYSGIQINFFLSKDDARELVEFINSSEKCESDV